MFKIYFGKCQPKHVHSFIFNYIIFVSGTNKNKQERQQVSKRDTRVCKVPEESEIPEGERQGSREAVQFGPGQGGTLQAAALCLGHQVLCQSH